MIPKFSVVIPTFNRESTLRETLAALVTQDYSDFEIIVVDDGSTDGTREMVAAEFPTVRYFHQSNRGPAAARNRGIYEARGEIIAFTDDDCIAPRDWLARLTDGYARYADVAGVGGVLQPSLDLLKSDLLAQYEDYLTRQAHRVDERKVVGGFECPVGGTNNMSYRRAMLEQVGGFDESFPYAAGEDADLKWRICQLGVRLLFVPVPVEHRREYNWQSFKQQSYMRGKGRACFDEKRQARRGKIWSALRLFWRWIHFPADLFNRERSKFAVVHFGEAWYNFRGEWDWFAESRGK